MTPSPYLRLTKAKFSQTLTGKLLDTRSFYCVFWVRGCIRLNKVVRGWAFPPLYIFVLVIVKQKLAGLQVTDFDSSENFV